MRPGFRRSYSTTQSWLTASYALGITSPVFAEMSQIVPGSDYNSKSILRRLSVTGSFWSRTETICPQNKCRFGTMSQPWQTEADQHWIPITNWPRWVGREVVGLVAMGYRFWQHCSLLPLWPSVVGGTLMSTTLFPGDSSWADRSAICFCETMR